MRDIAGYYAILFPLREKGFRGQWGVEIPDVPNANTFGKSKEHAIQMAQEAMNLALSSDLDYDHCLPCPSPKPKAKKGQVIEFLSLDANVRIAYLVRDLRKMTGLSQKDMAKRLGITFQSYQRYENPSRANLSAKTLDRVARAAGKQAVFAFE